MKPHYHVFKTSQFLLPHKAWDVFIFLALLLVNNNNNNNKKYFTIIIIIIIFFFQWAMKLFLKQNCE